MKFVQKKCPNCGSNLNFNINDKEVTCGYCNSQFIIEDDGKDNIDSINLISKLVKGSRLTMTIISISFIAFMIGIIITISYMISSGTNKSNSSINISVSEINNRVENKLFDYSKEIVEKWNSNLGDYYLKEKYQDFGFYYLKNSVSVRVIYVVKQTYSNGSNDKDVYTSIMFNGKDLDSLSYNGFISTNTINLSKYNIIYGYDSIDKLYDNVVQSYRSLGYKIVSKLKN